MLRAQVVNVLAAALFGKGVLADAAVKAINTKLAVKSANTILADGSSSTDAEKLKEMERTAAAAAEEAEAHFAKISLEAMSLEQMGPEEIKQAYEAENERLLAQLVKAKAEAVREIKVHVASRL